MSALSPCVNCGYVAWDPRRGVCYACRTLGAAAGPGAPPGPLAPRPPGAPAAGAASALAPLAPGTHVFLLAADKSMVPAVVLELDTGRARVRFANGTEQTVEQRLMARDVPAEIVETDGSDFDRVDGRTSGADEQRGELELVASIGAVTRIPQVRGAIARLDGAVLFGWNVASLAPGLVAFVDVRWARVARGSVRIGVRRPDGRAVSALAVPGRPVQLAAPSEIDIEGRSRVRLDAGPGGAEGIDYEIWLGSGPAR